jgi:hypothetical protein
VFGVHHAQLASALQCLVLRLGVCLQSLLLMWARTVEQVAPVAHDLGDECLRDVIDLMQLANRYGMAGLRKLCEKAVIEELGRNVWERVLRTDVDSIAIAEQQRASQLTLYLTRFIGAHQHVIRKHQPDSWTQLETTMPAHLEVINEHKWPPQRYFEILEAFELRDSAAHASTSWVRRILS